MLRTRKHFQSNPLSNDITKLKETFSIIALTFQQIAEDRSGGGGSRGANGHGFYDYKRGKFVMADGRYEQALMTNTSSNTNASTNTNMYTYKYKHGFYCNKHGKIVNYDKYKYDQTLMGGRNFSYC